MKIFISWSGQLSKQVADLLAKWIPDVLQHAKPWVSTQNLEKGRVWSEQIFQELNECSFGVSCVTKENRSAAWLLFEAGALSKGLQHNFVCPLAIDLDYGDVDQPLGAFNVTKPQKDDMLKLIKTINSSKPETALSDDHVVKSFERCWKEFEDPFKQILATGPVTAPAKRATDDMVAEVLQLCRLLHGSMEQLAANPFTSALPSLALLAGENDPTKFLPWVLAGSNGMSLAERNFVLKRLRESWLKQSKDPAALTANVSE